MAEAKTMEQFIDSDELINLLPHKGKMCFLSLVTQHDVNVHTIRRNMILRKIVFFMKRNLTAFLRGQDLSLWRREFLRLRELQIA